MFSEIITLFIILGIIVLMVLAVGLIQILNYLDFIIVLILIFYRQWWLAGAFIILLILYNTIQNYKKDIFLNDCKNFRLWDVQAHLDDNEWVNAMIDYHHGKSWEEAKSYSCRYKSYVLFPGQHACECKPCILYAANGRLRALVYHLKWHYSFFKQKHEFLVRYEPIDKNR